MKFQKTPSVDYATIDPLLRAWFYDVSVNERMATALSMKLHVFGPTLEPKDRNQLYRQYLETLFPWLAFEAEDQRAALIAAYQAEMQPPKPTTPQ